MKNKIILGFTIIFIMVSVIGCIKKDGTSSSRSVLSNSSKVKTNPESDFEAEPVEGGQSVRITNYLGDKWEVGIPSTIQKLPVTHIGSGAFSEKKLTSVTLPNSIIEIGEKAFADNQLTSITIPNSVIIIGDEAFANNLIIAVSIPNTVTYLSGFNGNQLSSINIPDNVTTIGNYAFSENKIASVVIPKSVNEIGYNAFYNNLLNIDYEFQINNMEISITQYIGTTKDVLIPDTILGLPVTSIADGRHIYDGYGTGAFSSQGFTNVTIPNSITYIGDYAFYQNQLTSINIPNNVTNIGGQAFESNQLTNINIPNSVTSIGKDAFWGNPLNSITIGANVYINRGRYDGGFYIGFCSGYIRGGQEAGTYTPPDSGNRSWIKK